MTKNIGTIDRIIRIVIGSAIIIWGAMNNSLLGAIGLIPLLTAAIGWCPLYCPLKINTTCDKDNCKK